MYSWGFSDKGLLGLGNKVTFSESPLFIEKLKDIQGVSISDQHCIALNFTGVAYSWGEGSFGELGQGDNIFSPYPEEMLSSQKYKNASCSTMVSCFLTKSGKFTYFGNIIKLNKVKNKAVALRKLMLESNNSQDQFKEKYFSELDNSVFTDFSVGDGFVTLLSDKGIVYSVDFSDNITQLFSNSSISHITVVSNAICGLSRPKNASRSLYLWEPDFGDDVKSDQWKTTMFSINEDCQFWEFVNQSKSDLVIINRKRNDLKKKLSFNLLDYSRKCVESENMHDSFESPLNQIKEEKQVRQNCFTKERSFDDSYNIKFKRTRKTLEGVVREKKLNWTSSNNMPLIRKESTEVKDQPSVDGLKQHFIESNKSKRKLISSHTRRHSKKFKEDVFISDESSGFSDRLKIEDLQINENVRMIGSGKHLTKESDDLCQFRVTSSKGSEVKGKKIAFESFAQSPKDHFFSFAEQRKSPRNVPSLEMVSFSKIFKKVLWNYAKRGNYREICFRKFFINLRSNKKSQILVKYANNLANFKLRFYFKRMKKITAVCKLFLFYLVKRTNRTNEFITKLKKFSKNRKIVNSLILQGFSLLNEVIKRKESKTFFSRFKTFDQLFKTNEFALNLTKVSDKVLKK